MGDFVMIGSATACLHTIDHEEAWTEIEPTCTSLNEISGDTTIEVDREAMVGCAIVIEEGVTECGRDLAVGHQGVVDAEAARGAVRGTPIAGMAEEAAVGVAVEVEATAVLAVAPAAEVAVHPANAATMMMPVPREKKR